MQESVTPFPRSATQLCSPVSPFVPISLKMYLSEFLGAAALYLPVPVVCVILYSTVGKLDLD